MSERTRGSRLSPMVVRVIVGTVVVIALIAVVVIAVTANSSTEVEDTPRPTTTVESPTTVAAPSLGRIEPGRIAYVTPSGDVVVANSDGSEPLTIGSEAKTNAQGLAPLAWRMPAADQVTYVRRDGALISAPIDGTEPVVLATDAVVPADATENIVSWAMNGAWLVYLAQPVPGRIESRVIDLSSAEEGGAPEVRTIGDPINRKVRSQFFSPLDPIIFQDTVDPESGRPYTAAVLGPYGGVAVTSNHSVDDASFSPDGRFIFAVSKASAVAEQLVRISLRNPLESELVFDSERVCSPSMSPDGRLIVVGAGPDCSELWRINSNGTEPTKIASDIAGVTFSHARLTWSLDSATVTHPMCQGFEGTVSCSGSYLDFDVNTGAVTERAVAGNVIREPKPLVRNIKVDIEVTGPIEYTGRMQVGERSVAEVFAIEAGAAPQVKAVDALDNARSFELRLVYGNDSDMVSGTIRIVDAGFDETIPFFGRLTPYSLGYAKLRGIWIGSDQVPLTSGNIVITLER